MFINARLESSVRRTRLFCWQPVLIFMLTTLATAQPTQALRNVKVGDKVPPFSIRDTAGKSIDNATFQDKVLLLIFARPEQDHSVKALKAAQRILRKTANTKLAVVAVSTKPDAAAYFSRVASEHGLTFPIAQDPDRKMYGDFGLIVAPTTLLIDESGVLRFELPHLPPSFERKLVLHTSFLLGEISRARYDALLSGKDTTKLEQDAPFQRRFAMAQTLVERGDHRRALPILDALKSERPNAVRVSTLLGTCHLALGNVDEAAKCLDPLAKSRPVSPRIALTLARLEICRGNDAAAETHLVDALKLSPNKGPILFELGYLFERKGDLQRAVDCYRDALREIYGSPAVFSHKPEPTTRVSHP